MTMRLDTIEQARQRASEIATRRMLIAWANTAKAANDAIIARLEREIAELLQTKQGNP